MFWKWRFPNHERWITVDGLLGVSIKVCTKNYVFTKLLTVFYPKIDVPKTVFIRKLYEVVVCYKLM